MQTKQKSVKNKTIDISVEDGQQYIERCVVVHEPVALQNVLDKTIIGDTMQVLPCLPAHSVDLLIVDPPYNLTKDFHGNAFRKMDNTEYEAYIDSWMQLCVPLLKDTATIYVCCDWASSYTIEAVLRKYFHVHNRITWQREKGRGALSNWKKWYGRYLVRYGFQEIHI